MTLPTKLLDQFPCSDYLDSPWARSGVWDEGSQLMVVVPVSQSVVHHHLQFLEIGRPGFDGILFGYRSGKSGLWAYYPIDDDFSLMAPNLEGLVNGWLTSQLSV